MSRRRNERLIDDLMKTRDPDGYIGHMKAEPEDRQNFIRGIPHDQEFTVLGLVDDWRLNRRPESLWYARELATLLDEKFLRIEWRFPDVIS